MNAETPIGSRKRMTLELAAVIGNHLVPQSPTQQGLKIDLQNNANFLLLRNNAFGLEKPDTPTFSSPAEPLSFDCFYLELTFRSLLSEFFKIPSEWISSENG